MLLSACGKVTDDDKSSKKSAGGFPAGLYDSSEESSEPAKSGEKVSASDEVGYNGDDTVTRVELIPDESIDISDKVRFEDMYERHVLHTGVVGRVGAPVELDFDKNEVRGGTLVFTYDPKKLSGVRPDALMFLWYDEANDNYVEKEVESLDTDAHTVSLHITEPGTYLLVNMYTWLNAWGADLDDDGMEDGFDPSSIPLDTSSWERNGTVGQLPDIADQDYIADARSKGTNSFEVSSAEELAAAVCLINCGMSDANISIKADIDLSGYQWAPIGWSAAGNDNRFTGVVNGNGHTIKNMTIECNGKAGFIGDGCACEVYDLNFENAKVSGNNCGIIIGDENSPAVENCTVSGEVSGDSAGAIGGECTAHRFINCKADVLVNGEKAEYLTCKEAKLAEVARNHPPKEIITVDKNNCVCREAGLENKYDSLGWEVYYMGNWCLSRSAKNETVFDVGDICGAVGTYEVYLTAWIEGGEIPISNKVTVDFGSN